MSYVPIPMKLNGHSPAKSWIIDRDDSLGDTPQPREVNIITGVDLTPQMVRRLEQALRGQSIVDRLQDLADNDPEASEVYRLRKTYSAEVVARQLGVSVRTVQRRLLRAHRTMEPASRLRDADGLSYEERLHELRQKRPRHFAVHLLNGYGWRLKAVAEHLEISESTCKRLSAESRAYTGNTDRRVLWRLRSASVAVKVPKVADDRAVA